MRQVLIGLACLLAVNVVGTGAAFAEERPFSGSLSGNASLTPTSDPCVLQNNETAVGTGTHLGRFTWESEEFANFCSVPGGVSVAGSFVITAADGDELHGVYTTIGLFDSAGNLIIHGTFEIDGGTGRFSEATASGDLDAIGFLTPGLPVVGRFSGTIDY